MILLLVFITECYSYITYDTGYAASFAWINGYRECWKNDNDTKEFTFSGQFERVPQILLIMSRYNLDQPSPNGYDFLITQISQTKFSASIYCKYNIRTYETPFYWFAYDDKRVQVISEYNYDIPAYTGSLNIQKTYPHNNPNFQKAIIQLTSFHSTGVWDFVLSVVGLTKTDVTISIKSNNSYFIRVGYQIFLSVDSALTIDPQIITNSILYTSPTITFPSNKDIAISTQGFKWSTTIIRLATSYAADYYTYGIWGNSQCLELRFTPIYFLKVIPTIYKSMLGKVRISQTDSLIPLVIPFFELDIIELAKIYNLPTIETLYIGSDITNLNLILKYNCPSQQQLSLNLLTQIQQITNRKIVCQKRDNLVTMYFTFRPQTTAIQELQLTITSNSITLSQKIQNIVVQNIQLFQFNFSN